MPKAHSISVRVTTLLLVLLAIGFAAEPRRVSVYAPQTNYQIDILVRDGVDYVGLTDLLEPLGRLESHIQGNKLILVFNGAAAEFQDGKRQYRTRSNNKLELASNFLLVDGRGYIPDCVDGATAVEHRRSSRGVPRRATPLVRGLDAVSFFSRTASRSLPARTQFSKSGQPLDND